jgi:hypothetical protein
VFGAKGMVRSDDLRPTAILKSNEGATDAHDVLLPFFVERYAQSYVHEIDDHRCGAVAPQAVGWRRGRTAGAAAGRTGRTVTVGAV